MNKNDLIRAVDGLDDDLIVSAAEASKQHTVRNTVLAVLAVCLAAAIILPLWRQAPVSPVTDPDTVDLKWMHDASDPESVAVLALLAYSDMSNEERTNDMINNGFDQYEWHGLRVSAELYGALNDPGSQMLAVSVYMVREKDRPGLWDFSMDGHSYAELSREANDVDRKFISLRYVLDVLAEARNGWTHEELVGKIEGNIVCWREEDQTFISGYLNKDPVDAADFDEDRMQQDFDALTARLDVLARQENDLRVAYHELYPPVSLDYRVFESLGIWSERNACEMDCYVNSSVACFAVSPEQLRTLAETLAKKNPDALGVYYFTLACRDDIFPLGTDPS